MTYQKSFRRACLIGLLVLLPSLLNAAEPASIKLTGIAAFSAKKRVMLLMKQPGATAEVPVTLKEGESQGVISVTRIDEKTGHVFIKNAGKDLELCFERNGAVAPPAPAVAVAKPAAPVSPIVKGAANNLKPANTVTTIGRYKTKKAPKRGLRNFGAVNLSGEISVPEQQPLEEALADEQAASTDGEEMTSGSSGANQSNGLLENPTDSSGAPSAFYRSTDR